MRHYDRRTFLKGSAMLAAAAAAGRLFPGHTLGAAALRQAPARPLEMLVLGDSVAWGQGLEEGEKFYTLARKWLERNLNGRAVNAPKVKAHSGATILPAEPAPESCHGEVNFDRPSIYAQLRRAADEYRAAPGGTGAVDLVLIDGGINDLGAFNLVKPFVSKARIREQTQRFCYAEMKKLLGEVVNTFCNARVVVTGYFPIISAQTPPDMFLELALLGFGDIQFISWFGRKVFELVRKGVHLDPGEAGPILKHATEVSDLWYRESTLALQRAVGEVNSAANASGAPCPPGAGGAASNPLNRRVLYAHVNFRPEHGYGAPRTLLWKLEDANRPLKLWESPVERLKTDDRFFTRRADWCKCEEARKSRLKYRICQRAGAAHPRDLGALEYAKAIEKELSAVLPFAGWAR